MNAVPRVSDVLSRFAPSDPRNHIVARLADVAAQHLEAHNNRVAAEQAAAARPSPTPTPAAPRPDGHVAELARQKERDRRKINAGRVTGKPSVSRDKGGIRPTAAKRRSGAVRAKAVPAGRTRR